MQPPTVICLMGPTASGKTDLSLQLACEINAEIISVDSAMVYLGMDIGTAKPSIFQQQQISHYLIDICDPTQPYSAAKFQQDANQAIATILAKNKIPLLVGGTMLYFKALQRGLSPLPSANGEIRKILSAQADEIGWLQLHKKLATVDPESASRIKPTDSQRIQRALEVYMITGRSLSKLWQTQNTSPYTFVNIALWPEDRSLLHNRIAYRFQSMLQAGFIDEVNELYQCEGLHADLPAIRSVGYRQVWQYLNGDCTIQEMERKAVAATRQLAKRQLTWLRHWNSVFYLNFSDFPEFSKLLAHIKNLLYQPLKN